MLVKAEWNCGENFWSCCVVLKVKKRDDCCGFRFDDLMGKMKWVWWSWIERRFCGEKWELMEVVLFCLAMIFKILN